MFLVQKMKHPENGSIGKNIREIRIQQEDIPDDSRCHMR